MPKLYVLVGVPGSGKSTWVDQQDWKKECVYVSTDMWVDLEAERQGKTYNEIFSNYMPLAVKLMCNQVENSRELGLDIIWDQTSTTIASRKKKFDMLPDYYKIAVVFPVPECEEHKRRLTSRPGKVIPQRVIIQMLGDYQPPTLKEGFDEIWQT